MSSLFKIRSDNIEHSPNSRETLDSLRKSGRLGAAQLAFIRENFRKMGDAELAKAVQCSTGKVKKNRERLGLLRTEEEVRKIQAQHPNCFKEGSEPTNKLQIGEKIKRSDGLWWIKTDKGMVQYHRWLFQQHGRKLKPNEVVVFKKRIKSWQRIRMHHLKVMTRQELARQNYHPKKARQSCKRTWRKKNRKLREELKEMLLRIEELRTLRRFSTDLIELYEIEKKEFPGLTLTSDVIEARDEAERLKKAIDRIRLEYFKKLPVKTNDRYLKLLPREP